MLMGLLVIIGLGFLSLSSTTLRINSRAQARADAQANARFALMMALGELQSQLGPDQRISAPSAILDENPATANLEGVAHPHLTGVWNARDAVTDSLENYNNSAPDYSRDQPHFRRWLVSQAGQEAQQLRFALDGSLQNPISLLGSQNPALEVKASRVPVKGGSFAWWVGEENTKALINRRDLLARESNPATAELMASFGSPGAQGIKGLSGFNDFPANSSESDKGISREQLTLLDPQGTRTRNMFHDITPYAESVLANVTNGSLRKDLSLYLERRDINWLRDWKNPNWQSGPLGPNQQIALSPLDQFDVLSWKSLHHYYNMHRQVSYVNNRPRVTATDNNAPAAIDPISNPQWNNGVTMINPVIVRMQYLISYAVSKAGENDYNLHVYSYPVVTLWNPYNVDMRINGYNIWIHNLPLSHRVFRNNAATSVPDFTWMFGGGMSGGVLAMRFGQPFGSPNSPIILRAGEQKIFNPKRFDMIDGTWPSADMAENTDPTTFYSPAHVGHRRNIGRINGAQETDRLAIETRMQTWEMFSPELKGYGWQSTFEIRSEPRGNHPGHDARMRQQLFTSSYSWRFENSSPSSNQLSASNFPAKPLRELVDAPTPFCLVESRLKPLDEMQLPNKTWLNNIPGHTYAGCTSSYTGADPKTPFSSHPFTVTFDQRTSVIGLFSTIPYMGPSYTPAGQRFVADLDVPQVPLNSLAQLQNLPQVSMESLQHNGLLQQNHAIGNSFASPGVPSDQLKKNGWSFSVNPYFPSQGGSLTGQMAAGNTWIPAPNIDRSYAANHLLFDEFFFSSMAPQTSSFYQRFGSTRSLTQVVRDFFASAKSLPNAAYRPYLARKMPDDVSNSLVAPNGNPLADAHLKSAAHLMVEGGFNINSTSVPAWTILLASSHLKRPVIMDTEQSGVPAAQQQGNFVVSRFAMPIGGRAGQQGNEDTRWPWSAKSNSAARSARSASSSTDASHAAVMNALFTVLSKPPSKTRRSPSIKTIAIARSLLPISRVPITHSHKPPSAHASKAHPPTSRKPICSNPSRPSSKRARTLLSSAATAKLSRPMEKQFSPRHGARPSCNATPNISTLRTAPKHPPPHRTCNPSIDSSDDASLSKVSAGLLLAKSNTFLLSPHASLGFFPHSARS
jgi:hypothetical protein